MLIVLHIPTIDKHPELCRHVIETDRRKVWGISSETSKKVFGVLIPKFAELNVGTRYLDMGWINLVALQNFKAPKYVADTPPIITATYRLPQYR